MTKQNLFFLLLTSLWNLRSATIDKRKDRKKKEKKKQARKKSNYCKKKNLIDVKNFILSIIIIIVITTHHSLFSFFTFLTPPLFTFTRVYLAVKQLTITTTRAEATAEPAGVTITVKQRGTITHNQDQEWNRNSCLPACLPVCLPACLPACLCLPLPQQVFI